MIINNRKCILRKETGKMTNQMRQTPLTCSGHTRPVVFLDFSDITPFGYFLISACKDGKPMLRQGDTGDWIGTFEGHKGAVWGATLNKEATKAATGAADFSAKLWDALSGEELHSFTHKHIVKSVNFATDSTQLLTGSNEKLLRIFDLNNPTEDAKATFTGHTSNIKNALFTYFDKRVVSASDDKTVRVWDVTSGEEIHKFEFPTAPNSIDISKDGTILVVSHGNFTSFWNAERFDKIKEYEAPTQINSTALHPDKKVFVSGGEDLRMYKFDYETGEELANPRALTNTVFLNNSMFFGMRSRLEHQNLRWGDIDLKTTSAGERYLEFTERATKTRSGSTSDARAFSPKMFENKESFKGHFGPVHCVKFSPDGDLYASGSEDGTLRLWQTTVGKTYGLWKCVMPDETVPNSDSTPVKAET